MKRLILFLIVGTSLFAQYTPPGGGGGGATAYSCTVAFANGTCTVTHNLNTINPDIGAPIVFSGCGSCYSIGTFTSSTFTVTSSTPATLIFPVSYASSLPANFYLSTSITSGATFQSRTLTATVTMGAISGYSGTVTLSCPTAASGVTCSFSPATITGSGASTLTVTASGSATTGANNLIVSGTDGTLTNAVPAISLTIYTGPVQQWSMNEGTSPMSDSSGHANNLTNTGVTYTNVIGLLSNSVTYAGSTSSYSVSANNANANFNGSTPFTVCAWVYQTSGITAASTFVGNLAASPTYQGWALGFGGGSANEFIVFLENNDGGNNRIINYYQYTPPPTSTHHFCLAYDGSRTSAGAVGYADGVALAINHTAGTLSATTASGTNIYIGKSSDGSFPLNGAVADVPIFNYQLTAPQILAIYNGGPK
jgi:hypothetical protein